MPATEEVVRRFNDALNNHDLDAAMSLVAEDVAFEAASPGPNGATTVGRDAVAAAFEPVVQDKSTRTTVEGTLSAGAQVVQWWLFESDSFTVRGIDVLTVRDGLITSKRVYVKA